MELSFDIDVAVQTLWLYRACLSVVAIALQGWNHTCKGRPKMSAKWITVLKGQRPDLAAVVAELVKRSEDQSRSSNNSSSSSSGSSSSFSWSSGDDEVDDRKRTGDTLIAHPTTTRKQKLGYLVTLTLQRPKCIY